MKKQINDKAIKDITNRFRLEKETEATKDRIIRNIRNLFQHEKDCYTQIRVGNFSSNNYIEYKVKGSRKHYQMKKIFVKLDHT